MNDRTRKLVARVITIMGASASAMSVAFFAGIKNSALLIPLSFLAGTAGHFACAWLATRLMRLEKRLSWGRPGKPVYRFSRLPRGVDTLSGGKGWALARLYQAGFAVPDGCVLLSTAFDGDELTAEAWQLVKRELNRLRGGKLIPLAVRSSALNEDSAQASFAGEFESVLHVESDEEVREAVRAVRRSRHNARVKAYGEARGLGGREHAVAVVLQKMVRPDASGVLFTADPLTGDLARMTGNVVPGLGDQLVAGEVSAEEFAFTRPDGVYSGPTRLSPVAKQLHREAHEIERELGGPQDIEWAAAHGKVFILQARPITTLNGYNPVTAEWNDTLKGDFLWSGTNLMEAQPDVLTPFTASLRPYLEAYGHRGENEGECAWPRPLEDPAWLDRQLAEWAGNPVDIEAMLARQRTAYDAAWQRFCRRHPRKVYSTRNRLQRVAKGARQRELVRSEATRGIMVVRGFALKAGEMLEIGEEVFLLTIDELLAALEHGDTSALGLIATRQEIHARYRDLPPYPTLIRGRFDPFAWAADPNRRGDLYDSRSSAKLPAAAAERVIRGAAGAWGVVEGSVRKLDRLSDSEQFRPGEVLVTTMTNIGWTPIFPRAAAIVTDLGAPLSHAAIVARELGIPAVVGCGDATMRLRTGDRVRVHGGQGLVEIVSGRLP